MFGNNRKFTSPVEQAFIWVAEYADGTCTSEFDFHTREEQSFYNIKRDELIRFGLIGGGGSMYFENYSGIFKIMGQMIEMNYVTENSNYQLNGRPAFYNDIITYKDAEFLFNPKIEGSGRSAITQFNFGYKVNFSDDDIDFHFQAICQIPLNQLARLDLKIVTNTNLDGRLEIKRNGKKVDDIHAPLCRGVGGSIVWELK
ncbi:hypothetical protein ABEW34_17155 [Paenibacillus algorifonticola]|uniref:hypothetical protein n=1 Tax=Paenibacillus algorifonticola TaxID=684063 RepID=UPI003D28E1F0